MQGSTINSIEQASGRRHVTLRFGLRWQCKHGVTTLSAETIYKTLNIELKFLFVDYIHSIYYTGVIILTRFVLLFTCYSVCLLIYRTPLVHGILKSAYVSPAWEKVHVGL